jgi:hypothetical protein
LLLGLFHSLFPGLNFQPWRRAEQVRLQCAYRGDGLVAVGAFTDQFNLRIAGEQQPLTGPQRR